MDSRAARSPRHVAGGERGADRAGTNRPPLVLEARHDIDREAELGALRREIFGRARTVEAEMKIEADGDAGDGEPPDQDARDEILRGKPRQRRVEAQHDRAVEPGRGQEPQLRALVGEAEQRLVGPEEAAGCGSKVSAAAGRPSASARARAAAITARWPRCTPSKLPMATTAPSSARSRGRFATDHDERLGRLRLVGHGGRNEVSD